MNYTVEPQTPNGQLWAMGQLISPIVIFVALEPSGQGVGSVDGVDRLLDRRLVGRLGDLEVLGDFAASLNIFQCHDTREMSL